MAGDRQGLDGFRPSPSDWALAATITAVMAFDVGNTPSIALMLALVLPAGASFAWRRRWPVLPLALVCLTDLVLQATATGEYGPQTVVLGVVLAAFNAASLLQGRAAVLAGAASFTSVWASVTVTQEGDPLDFLALVIWGVPWLGGRLIRRQTLAARDAGARAALLEVEARDAAGRERDRIARELHDVVGHAVSLMVVQAGAERMALGDTAPRTRAALESVETSGRQALVELRAMLGVLRSTGGEDVLAPLPDLTGLQALVESVRAAGLHVDVDVSGDIAGVSAGVGLAGYRVVQEALTNALRHGSGSASVVVRIAQDLELEVRNPAVGAPTDEGRGLLGMRERVQLFGGTLSAGRVGAEWVVDAHLPLSVAVRS